MPKVTDACLMEELNTFMRSVPQIWSWDQIFALKDRAHVEQRGPNSNQLNFEFGVLENSIDDGRPYLNNYVSVYDFREGEGLGSAYMPLSNNFIWFQDGSLDLQCKQSFVTNPE